MWKKQIRVILILIGYVAGVGAAHAEDVVTFEKDILPIFVKSCNGCHSPQADKLKAELDLSTVLTLLKGSEYGEVVEPGNSAESMLVKTIEHTEEPHMPPPNKFDKLPQEEIDLIKKWIDQGAKAGEGGASDKKEATNQPDPSSSPKTALPDKDWAESPIASVAYSPDGKWLARGRLGVVELFAVKDDGSIEKADDLSGHAEMVRGLAFSPDSERLAAGGGKPGRSGEIVLWDIPKGEQFKKIEGHSDNILDLDFHPDGEQIATGSYDKTVRVWNIETAEETHLMKDHVDAVYSVDYSDDGTRLASGSGDRTVKLWDAETGERVLTLSDSTDAVHTVAFAPKGDLIAAGASDKMIRVWDLLASQSEEGFTQSALTTGQLLHSTFAHDGPLLKILYSKEGDTLYSTAQDKQVKAWDTSTMSLPKVYEVQSDWAQCMDLHPNGNHLAVGRFDGTMTVYDSQSGRSIWTDGTSTETSMASADVDENEIDTKGKRKGKTGKIHVDAVFIDATIPPIVDSLSPDVWPRGSTVELTVKGRNLADAELYFTDKKLGIEVTQFEAKPVPEFKYNEESRGTQFHNYAQPYEIKMTVDIPSDAGLGTKHLFADTPIGLSNAKEFKISDSGDTGEVEPNDTLAEAQEINFPIRLVGTTNLEGDVDRYKVHLEKGQELVCVLRDTGLNPLLRILTAEGEEQVTHTEFNGTDNPHVAVRAEETGDYLIEISDRDRRRNMSYRLHIGEFPYVAEVAPLGIATGSPQKVWVRAYNIGGVSELEVTPPGNSPHNRKVDLPLPDYEGYNPAENRQIVIGHYTETSETEPNNTPIEAQVLDFGSTVNGRLYSEEGADEADVYRFSAEKGQEVLFEVMAAQLGSPIDSFIEILGSDGKLLERGRVRCIAQTKMTLSDRDSQQAGLRIEDWSDLGIGDYVMVGSEILKVLKIPDYADEDAVMQQYPDGQRRAYFGTTPEHHAVSTPVYKVEVHPAKTEFEPNGMPVFDLYWRNDDSHQYGSQSTDSRLLFTAPESGDFFVRLSDTIGSSGPDHRYRLTLRNQRPDFALSASPYRINVETGSRVPMTVTVRREDEFEGPIHIVAHDLPEGIEIEPSDILESESDVNLAVVASPRATSSERGSTVRITGTGQIDGEEVVREVLIGEIIAVDKQPDLLVNNGVDTLRIKPGESQWLSVNIDRYNGFSARIPIDVLNLPFGVYVTDTGLNGILVREGETERSMQIYCESWVEPMERDIFIQAKVEAPAPARLLFVGEPIRLIVGQPGNGDTKVAEAN